MCAKAGRSLCCTTARRMPTARSTSATPSTKYSRTWSSRRASSRAWMRFMCRAGIATVSRSKTPSKNCLDGLCRVTRCRRKAALLPPSKSPARWPTSSAWACWASGTTRTAPWISATRPMRSARSNASWSAALSTAASSPCTGVLTAAPRWLSLRSNTPIKSHRRWTSALPALSPTNWRPPLASTA